MFTLIINNGCKSDNPVKSSDYFIGTWYIKKYTYFYGSNYDSIELKISADNSYSFYGFNSMFYRSEKGKWGFNDSNSVLTFDDNSYSVIQKNTDSMVLSIFGDNSTFILYKK
jgi:hypothetical protein